MSPCSSARETKPMKKNNADKKNKALYSPYIWAVLALFAVVFTVNYAFVKAAISTSPGLVTEKYYKYGLQQNKFDQQFATQAKRGWRVVLDIDKHIQAGQPSIVTLSVSDRYAQPISQGHAELRAYRPSNEKLDVLLSIKETNQPGVYQATITLPTPGVWDMNLLFAKDEDKHMLNQRIVVQGTDTQETSILENIVNFITR